MTINFVVNNPSFNHEISNNNNYNSESSKLRGRQISLQNSQNSEKINSCWEFSECHLEPKEPEKNMQGIDSFDFEDEFILEEFGSVNLLIENDELNAEIVFQNEEVKTSDQAEIVFQEEEIVFQEEERQDSFREWTLGVGSAIQEQLTSLDMVYNPIFFEIDINELQEIIRYTMEEKKEFVGDFVNKDIDQANINRLENGNFVQLSQEEKEAVDQVVEGFIGNFIDNAINQDKMGRLVNGNFVPLNEKEKEALRQALKIFIKDYVARFPILTRTRLEEEKSTENKELNQLKHSAKFSKDSDNYTLAVYTPDRNIFSENWQIEIIIKSSGIAQSILLEAIIKKGQEEATKERILEKMDLLCERILAAILKSEILKSDVSTSEIKLQHIKIEVNKTLNMPNHVLVKLTRIINKSNKSIIETAFMQLPGLHKLTPAPIKASS